MHIQYLEARLIDEGYAANRYVMDNAKTQQVPIVSRPDQAAMEEIIPDIRLISGVLGHLIFEPAETPISSPEEGSPKSLIGRLFTFVGPHYDAQANIPTKVL